MAAFWSDIKTALGGAVAQGARRVAERLDKGPAVRMGSIPGLRPVHLPQDSDDRPAKVPEPKAMFSDPYSVMQAFGYKDRQASISYDTLREIIYRLPIVSNVIQVRVEQVAAFGHIAADRFQMGFRVKLRNHHGTPSSSEEALCRRFEKFVLNTGLGQRTGQRDSFETYLRKITRDALVFDQNCTEIVPGNDDRPAEFYAIDAANVRLASNLKGYKKDNSEQAAYVEVYNEAIRTHWRAKDLIFGVRNPNTDIRLNGYGTSELEYLMSTLTSLLNALNFNALNFTQGTMARGLLNIRDADISNRDLNTVEQRWNAMITGVQNAGRTPVIASKDGVEWINLQGPDGLQYREWMDFLIKVICGSFKMAPEEIQLSYGQIGQTSTLAQPSNEYKLVDSKERGLRPLLRHIQGNINQYLIWPHSTDLEFEFAGLDTMTRDQQVAFDSQRVSSMYTLNEVRAESDLPALPGGDVVLNGVYLQNKMQEQQVQQQTPTQDPLAGAEPQAETPTESFEEQKIPAPLLGAQELLNLGKSQTGSRTSPHRLDIRL